MSRSDAHHQALSAFVARYRNQLESYVDDDKEIDWIAEALLSWDREHHRNAQKGEP